VKLLPRSQGALGPWPWLLSSKTKASRGTPQADDSGLQGQRSKPWPNLPLQTHQAMIRGIVTSRSSARVAVEPKRGKLDASHSRRLQRQRLISVMCSFLASRPYILRGPRQRSESGSGSFQGPSSCGGQGGEGALSELQARGTRQSSELKFRGSRARLRCLGSVRHLGRCCRTADAACAVAGRLLTYRMSGVEPAQQRSLLPSTLKTVTARSERPDDHFSFEPARQSLLPRSPLRSRPRRWALEAGGEIEAADVQRKHLVDAAHGCDSARRPR